MYYVIISTHGSMSVDEQGYVLESNFYEPDSESAQILSSITRFDIERWRKEFGGEVGSTIDILDIGYWTPSFGYELPVDRSEFDE